MTELNLSPEQLDRYSRQLVLDGFGRAGQAALAEGSVLVVGAGGLGSPAIMYLAAAGVARIGIADDDRLERSNLQRQIIHDEAAIGKAKVESAADWVSAHNPEISVDIYDERVDKTTVEDRVREYDLVVDATDRFETRFLLNDACVLAETPYVYGAVYRFEGQLSTFWPAKSGPCYRCLFPEAPPAGAITDCATAGVLGPVPGTIGTLQSTEAIKLLAEIGELALGRLLVFDALSMSFESVKIAPNPSCPICGDQPQIQTVEDVDYTGRCRIEH